MRSVVLGAIAAFILLLYAACIAVAIVAPTAFTAAMASVLATAGALVSALAVAELAVTEPGKVPVARTLDRFVPGDPSRTRRVLAGMYLAVWFIGGVACLVYWMLGLGAVEAIISLGKGWFGAAMAALYAYFAIQPSHTRLDVQPEAVPSKGVPPIVPAA